MEYIHIRNLERYHPGYRDRELQWAKIRFGLVQGDPEFEMIIEEIDKWRFVALICLELAAKKPLPNSERYWRSKGFNLKKRDMSLTLQVLHNFLEYHTQQCVLEEISIKNEIKELDKSYSGFEQATVIVWNSLCKEFPILPVIQEISDKRRTKLKKRYEKKSFQDFTKIVEAIKEQLFLLGENERKWVISFDWLIENDTNYLKVLERRYKNNKDPFAKYKKEK